VAPAAVSFRPERACRVIGALIDTAAMLEILRSLGMHVDEREHVARHTSELAIRHRDRRRPDREVARIHGFETCRKRRSRSAMRPATEQRVPIERLADTLADRGYYEAVTYSFVDPAVQSCSIPTRRDS
jgi:phenylalanyl-tRNA synthetase beta chain